MPGTEFHPVSEIFPLMTGVAFDELVHDIQINGLHEPLWRHEGKIIDGRNRYNACLKAGVSPMYRDWDGNDSDLVKFVISLNLHRRHLNESQRAMVASKIATRAARVNEAADRPGSNLPQVLPPTCKTAGDMLNVSKSLVKAARKIRAEGSPEIVAAVENGSVSLHAAKQILAKPQDQRDEALAEQKKPKNERAAKHDPKKETFTKRHAGRKAPEAVRGAIGTLVGLATGLDSFTAKDAAPTPDEAKQWERDLLAVISAVNRFRRQLKELSDGNQAAA